MPRSSVRRLGRLASTLCVLPLLVGCFAYDTVVRVAPDGSGTVEQELVVTGPLAEMVRTAAEAGEKGDEMDLCEPSDLGEGVRLVSAVPILTEDRVGCRQVYAFADVNTLRLQLDPGGRLPEGLRQEGEGVEGPEEPISFSFQPGSPAVLRVRMPEQETGREEDEDEEEDDDAEEVARPKTAEDAAGQAMMMAMMREMLRGSRFSVQLVVEGDILETDAAFRDGNRVTLLEFDFDALLEDPEAFERLMETEDRSRDAARELLAETPGIRLETREEVVIRFR
jgi:hypothetical protein